MNINNNIINNNNDNDDNYNIIMINNINCVTNNISNTLNYMNNDVYPNLHTLTVIFFLIYKS